MKAFDLLSDPNWNWKSALHHSYCCGFLFDFVGGRLAALVYAAAAAGTRKLMLLTRRQIVCS